MRRICTLLTALGILGLLAGPAVADWDVGDPHKMHRPQLPDMAGWDVNFTHTDEFPRVLADDWRCSETGTVTDFHFWFSVRDDMPFEPKENIRNIHLSIHENVEPDAVYPWSRPGRLVWRADVGFDHGPGNLAVRPWPPATIPPVPQGWLDPYVPFVGPDDHFGTWQANIFVDPAQIEPFRQEEGEIYWLDLFVETRGQPGTAPVQLGWKTAVPRNPDNPDLPQHWFDDAVWWDPFSEQPDGTLGVWRELRDPRTGRSLDLAFVITPEPSTSVMLASAGLLGLLALLRRRRKPGT